MGFQGKKKIFVRNGNAIKALTAYKKKTYT